MLAACVGLAACATYPRGPSVLVMPSATANFDQFRADESNCRGYAQETIGPNTPQQAATASGLNSATVGTAIGAVAGTLIGAASGHPGMGAAIGAGSGLLLGSAVGTDNAYGAGSGLQDRYNMAYVQCMYAKGHRVPLPAGLAQNVPTTVVEEFRPTPNDPGLGANYPPPSAPGSYPTLNAPPPGAAYPPPNSPRPSGY